MAGRRAVRSVPVPAASVSLADRVRETVAELKLQPEDVAVSALAVEIAQTIDNAALLAAEAARLPYDPDTAAQVARLRARVDAHTVVAELGPKLLATLDALGATPRARAVAGKPAPAGSKSKLSLLREAGA